MVSSRVGLFVKILHTFGHEDDVQWTRHDGHEDLEICLLRLRIFTPSVCSVDRFCKQICNVMVQWGSQFVQYFENLKLARD